MKVTQKEIISYKKVYIACDGREFENEEDCKDWENSYALTMQSSFDNLKKVELNTTECLLPYNCEDKYAYAVIPKDMDEVVILNAYIRSKTDYCNILDNRHIGKVTILDFGYDFDYCDVYIYEEQIAKANKLLADVTAKING